ncbi:hypothetical protein Tco_1151379 [Tanacetum coccineum]
MPEDPYAYVVAAFQAPPSPDYVPGSEEPKQAPLSPEFVLEPVYLDFMPPEDEVFPTKEQPLPAAVSPTANSPGYIADFDLEEDPKEDPTDYPADGRDDDDGDDESSDDDEDDDDVEEIRMRKGRSTPLRATLSHHLLLAIPSPPPSPLSPWSSPLPQIPSPPLPVSPPLLVSSPVPVSPPPLPASPTYPLGYRAAMIRQRAESPSTSHSLPLPPPIILSHTRASVDMMRVVAPSTYILASRLETPPLGTPPLLPIPLPIPSPPLLLPSTDHRADRPEVCLPPQNKLCIALGPRYEVGESSSAPAARPTGGFRAGYGFVATLDRDIRRDPDRDEARAVLSGWLNLLGRDRGAHAYTALPIEREARFIMRPGGGLWRLAEIGALRAADRTRQAQLVQTLTLMQTLHTHVIALQGQQGPARGLAQLDVSEDADSSS